MKNLFSDWLSNKSKPSEEKTSQSPKPNSPKKDFFNKNRSKKKRPSGHHKSESNKVKSGSHASRVSNRPKQLKDNNPAPRLSKNPRHLVGFDQDRPYYDGPKSGEEPRLRIIPCGGVNEVGENSMLMEYGDDMILIDLGIAFPGKDAKGIDYYIPDLEYARKHCKRLKGIVITHGHLDHIGAIPYLIEKLNFPPIFATKLTMGFIKKRLEEFKLDKQVKLIEYKPEETLVFGQIKVGFYRVSHSIPDGVGVYVKTPTGSAVHSGDFKFCSDPSDGIAEDIEKMRKLGEKGVDVLFSDSTNALNPGRTIPDKEVAASLDKIIAEAKDRVIIATFSSQIGRMQEILNSALKHKRYVFTSGYSIESNFKIAKNLGYLKYPESLVKDSKEAKNIPDNKMLIISTGSQGEEQASIRKMIAGKHRFFKIKQSDTIIFSSSPIPGNEVAVYDMINNLSRLGANIIHNKILPVHTSGHAYKEECRDLIKLINPKNFAPIHGNHFMRRAHANIAIEEGLPKEKTFLIDNGDILEVYNGQAKILKERTAARYVVVDGSSVGVDGTEVIEDRTKLGDSGVMVLSLKIRNKKISDKINIQSRGVFYDQEHKKYYDQISKECAKIYDEFMTKNPQAGLNGTKQLMAKRLEYFVKKKIGREPLLIINIDLV